MGFDDETILFETDAIPLNLSFGIAFFISGKAFLILFLIPLVTFVLLFEPAIPLANITSLPISLNA